MTDIFNSTGISVSYGDPMWKTNRRDILGSLTNELTGYDHKISAFLGSASSQLGFMTTPEDMNIWAEEGLGRTIFVSDEYQVGIWEGFINEVLISRGTTQMKFGPMIEVANRVRAVYEEIDTTTDPPTSLGRTETTITEDARSQARYGVLEQIISVGQVETTLANRLRDIHLRQRRYPKTSLNLNLDDRAQPTIELQCLGIGDLLDEYIYENVAGTGTQTLSDRIKLILASDPNGLFLVKNIKENLFAVQEWENDYPTGLSALQELIPLGDAFDNRWLIYVKPGREFVYRAVEDYYDYIWSAVDNRMSNRAGNEIMPWTVEAGKFLKVTDFLTGRTAPDSPYDDPMAVFIESLQFTAPTKISFESSYVNNINQYLAKLGLGGSYI